jgi:hypothetical protein
MSALDKRWEADLKRANSSKKEFVEIDITDVNPTDLVEFMRKNNIPDTADFGISGDWEYNCPYPILYYYKSVEKTDEEKINDAIALFNKYGLKALREAGYKRKRYSPNLKDIKVFDDLYVMYVNKDYDALKKYFALYFDF